MEIIVYYEGDESVKSWFSSLVDMDVTYKKMPSRNDTSEYTDLPAYVSDILYLDKPDLIVSMQHDGHEKPLLSIEFACCTPQYQHSLQRFSRMLASISSGCPSILVIPSIKRENSGERIYKRSVAIEYGAVRLMDVFKTPCFVLDWPSDENHFLINEKNTQYPLIDSKGIQYLKQFIFECVKSREDINYIESLSKKKLVSTLTDMIRTNAYRAGVPSISNPGGGDKNSTVKLELIDTQELINKISASSPLHKALCSKIPSYILDRKESLVFYPTRITAHAGDPYVGMIGYYDIAFARFGKSTRERYHNMVAYAENVSIKEITDVMGKFVAKTCPFNNPFEPKNAKTYNYHMRYGCKETKSKPVRIYAELADIVIFKDGVLFNAG